MPDIQTTDPIESFLKAAEKRLRRHIADQQLRSIIDEARDHLTQRVEELIAGGAQRPEAEAAAVSSFGNVRTWSRAINLAAYSDSQTNPANIATACAGVTLIAAISIQWGAVAIPILAPAWSLMQLLALFALLVLPLASFRARRSVVKPLVVAGLISVAALFTTFGSQRFSMAGYDGTYSKPQVDDMVRSETEKLTPMQYEVGLLQLGTRTYASFSSKPTTSIPNILRANGGYIIPVPNTELKPGWNIGSSAFKISYQTPDSVPLSPLQREAISYQTVRSPSKAAWRWSIDGRIYLRDDYFAM